MSTDLNSTSELYQTFELNRKSLQLTHDKTAKASKVVTNILEFWGLKESPVNSLFEAELSKYARSSEYEFSDEFVFVTSLILGIYADLRKLFLQDMNHLEWLNAPGKHLDGEPPRVLIASGQVKNIESLRLFLKSCI
jgi:hypothetical protein